MKNVLFYQNEYPVAEQCMAWGWTVAVEVQFYVLAPLVTFLPNLIFPKAKENNLYALTTLIPLTVLLIVPRTTIPFDYNPPLTSLQLLTSTAHNSSDNYFHRMYASSETRIFSCFMGGAAGCVLQHIRNSSVWNDAKSQETKYRLLITNSISTISFALIVFLIFSDYTEIFSLDSSDSNFLIYFRPCFSLLLSVFLLSLGVSRHLTNLLNTLETELVGVVVNDGGNSIIRAFVGGEDNDDGLPKKALLYVTGLVNKILTPSWYKINSHTAHITSYDSFLLHPLLINGLYLVFLDDLKPHAMSNSDLPYLYVCLVLFNFYTAHFFASLMYCLIGKPMLDVGDRLLEKMGLGRNAVEAIKYVERAVTEEGEGGEEDDRESLLLSENDIDDENNRL
ncbi:hypothetical protein TrST_g35 [Triparma strigata]|uniref:Uncharacterized protein n=1 Tax=Triparma strigata TaxID=1606541 RepID=A0A9W7ASM7_9STRA|nr:hypothetical protein TrST_g35 [Triparma strigata]